MTEQELRETIYPQIKEQTLKSLPEFIDSLLNDHSHDYGSICCALAAGALATMNAMNKHKNAGITGFQAGCVMWEVIRQWNYKSNKTGLRIVDYDNMLYAQYQEHFHKTIDKNVFEALKKEAQTLLEEDSKNLAQYQEDMKQYEVDLAAFIEKYPDYHERPEHYKKLGIGNSDKWKAEQHKKESGFEFAPSEPYYHRGQIEHWQSIVGGVVPFGYRVKEN